MNKISIPANKFVYTDDYRISGININFSKNKQYIQRTIYSFTQLMADIGGFLNTCQFLGYVIVDWVISANADTFMIANLFF